MSDRKREAIAALALEHSREMQELTGDSKTEARAAFLELYTWTPEGMDNEPLAKHLKKAYHANGGEKGELPPFLCNLAVFEMLGKEQSRTFGALLRILAEAIGLTDDDMRKAMRDSDRSEEEVAERKITKETPLSAKDFDAIELTLRKDGRYLFEDGDGPLKMQRIFRALNATRAVYDAPHDPDWEYFSVKPKDLRIGDEIVRRGQWNQVLGFFQHEEKKRWTDKGMTFSEVPVGSKELDWDKKPKAYFVKTAFGGSSGENFKGQETLAIRRRKSLGDPPVKPEAPKAVKKPLKKKGVKKTSKKKTSKKKGASKKKSAKNRRKAA